VTAHPLERLYGTILAREGADPAASYTARLLAGGAPLAGKKLGEEAIEAVIAAVRGDRLALVAESADLLYHLLVLWRSAGIEPAEVWTELARREGVSGLAEKAARTQEGGEDGL
jgi:phosphoribosyl-ATP pyrophosphohydrolase